MIQTSNRVTGLQPSAVSFALAPDRGDHLQAPTFGLNTSSNLSIKEKVANQDYSAQKSPVRP